MGEAMSRHSALPSSETGSMAHGGRRSDRNRNRPIFQKSSSTPTARGAGQRQRSISPPLGPVAPHRKVQHVLGSGESVQLGRGLVASDYQASSGNQTMASTGSRSAFHEPRRQSSAFESQYGADLLPQMMEQLGRPSHDTYYHQQQQRRMLPQIMRPQSPSDIQSYQKPPELYHRHHHHDVDAGRANIHQTARHRHRRQSSLELERQEHQRLGYTEYQHEEERYLDRGNTPIGPGRYAGSGNVPPPPTISVSPEFHDPSVPSIDIDIGLRHRYQQHGAHMYQTYGLHEHSTDIMVGGADTIGPYEQHLRQVQQHHFPQYRSQIMQPSQGRYSPRSMAMGSDSELNTRGLSSNKLYYVHVPPGRRSRHHHHHHHQRRQEPISVRSLPQPSASQTEPRSQQMMPHTSRSHHPMPTQSEYPNEATHQAESPPILDPHQQYMVGPRGRTPAIEGHKFHTTRRKMPMPPTTAMDQPQQKQIRASKGVTFDGRTSAPVYGQSRQRDPRENYLRTSSEEYDTHVDKSMRLQPNAPTGDLSGAEDSEGEVEEGSSSIASRASNASYTAGDHQMQPVQSRGAITTSEFNISTGRNPRESWLADEGPHDDGKPYGRSGPPREARRASRGLEPPPQQAEQSTRDRPPKATPHQQQVRQTATLPTAPRLLHESGSLSDNGAASLSDKEAAPMSGGTPPTRSERRARVRDQQQSSNERSIGDGGGSSQSLRSQSGIQTSGGLSKKSNSTTQLSLSGEF